MRPNARNGIKAEGTPYQPREIVLIIKKNMLREQVPLFAIGPGGHVVLCLGYFTIVFTFALPYNAAVSTVS